VLILHLFQTRGLLRSLRPALIFRLRQLMHYVRPGAVRIAALSSDPSLHVLAFTSNGAVTTIIEKHRLDAIGQFKRLAAGHLWVYRKLPRARVHFRNSAFAL